jgi:hypothetical protein
VRALRGALALSPEKRTLLYADIDVDTLVAGDPDGFANFCDSRRIRKRGALWAISVSLNALNWRWYR